MSDAMINSQFTPNQKKEIHHLIVSTLENYDKLMRVKSGNIQSGNFSSGISGWAIHDNGLAEFMNVNIGYSQVTVAPGQNIQTAINQMALVGGTVFLTNGIHYVNNDLILANNVTIRGENGVGTVIDFGNHPYGIRIKGSNVYNTGTASVNVGSMNVSGSGTTWTSSMIGQQIFLSGYAYNILTVPSTTSLTIDQQYTSPGLSGNLVNGSYAICNAIGGVELFEITVQNSSDEAIDIEYTNISIIMENVQVYTSNYGIYINQCGGFTYNNGYIYACNYGFYCYNSDAITFQNISSYNIAIGDGIYFNNSGDSTIFNFDSSNCNGNGITFVNSFNTEIYAGTVNDNSGKGIEMVSGNNSIVLEGCTISGNTSDGVKLTATSNQNIVGSNVITANGGWGINIANANCSNNILNGNVYTTNTAGTYTNSGTSTRIF